MDRSSSNVFSQLKMVIADYYLSKVRDPGFSPHLDATVFSFGTLHFKILGGHEKLPNNSSRHLEINRK